MGHLAMKSGSGPVVGDDVLGLFCLGSDVTTSCAQLLVSLGVHS
jgi:hypothetical protein